MPSGGCFCDAVFYPSPPIPIYLISL
ncbi:hypothetical protein BCIN_02g01330 [Botrytis cinerea B05.10]|uniref:Uncharacterized protein n=1 Tax=Botryotinia fuckeliana (strain B05.10) TaxID=332648 RepID=A0A384J8G4_BOTFB|nr:hypothetical protein BCIN_02g01330 [Botrytis cinerea B05.10]